MQWLAVAECISSIWPTETFPGIGIQIWDLCRQIDHYTTEGRNYCFVIVQKVGSKDSIMGDDCLADGTCAEVDS